MKDEERYPGSDQSDSSPDSKGSDLMNKLGKAILETRLEAEISNLFSNINVTARTIKEKLKKQKCDILIDTPEKDKQDDEGVGGIDDILDQSKSSDLV